MATGGKLSDFEWLLKILSTSKTDFQLVYGLSFQIPEILILDDGEIKNWYYVHKGKILTRPESYLKLRVAQEYFEDPSSYHESTNTEGDFPKEQANKPQGSPEQVLFCVYIENSTKNLRLVKKLRRKVAEDLLKGNEFLDYIKSWKRIFSYIPQKDAGIFDVFVTKDIDHTNFRIKLFKRDFSLKDIEPYDYVKDKERLATHQRLPSKGKDDKTLSQINYVCLASLIIEKLEKFSKAIIRFLEGKTRLVVGEMHVEFVVDGGGQVWIVGCRNITFYNDNNQTLDPLLDKDNIKFPKFTFTKHEHCAGAYCEISKESAFHEDGDEAAELYSNKSSSTNEVPLKSIMLDLVERYKQLERIQKNITGFNEQDLVAFVENNPFAFRRYYSMGDLIHKRPLGIHTSVHLLKKLKICDNCRYVYEKIDGYRTKLLLRPENKKFDPVKAKHFIEKYFEENTKTSLGATARQIFSKEFYDKLKDFGKSILEIMGLHQETNIIDDFFVTNNRTNTFASTNRDQTIGHGHLDEGLTTPGGLSKSKSSIIYLPKVQTISIKDENNFVNLKKVKVKDNRSRNEVVGYKHFLGHIDNFPSSSYGFSLTKSSFRLNKLQDQLLYLNNVADRIQTEMTTDQSKEKLDLVMCPYYGNGVKDTKRLDAYMSQRTSNNRISLAPIEPPSRISVNRTSFINVIADTSDILEKKGDLLRKKSEFIMLGTPQKTLAESHTMLSQSILAKLNTQEKHEKPERPGSAESNQSFQSNYSGRNSFRKSVFAPQ